MSGQFSARRPILTGLGATAILFAAMFGWGGTARLEGAVIADGRVEVAQNRQVVNHPEGGIVAEIRVSEGTRVAVGDILIRLDSSVLQGQLADARSEIVELEAARIRLEAERDGTGMKLPPNPGSATISQRRILQEGRSLLARNAEQIGISRDRIEDEIAGIAIQENSLGVQLALVETERSDQQRLLDGGLTQRARVLALEREAQRLRGSLGAAMAARADAAVRISELDREAIRLRTATRDTAMAELRLLIPRQTELRARSRELSARIERMDIRAPVSGIVFDLRATSPGSVITPAQTLLYIVPQDRPMMISALVPAPLAGAVYPGQPARLRLPAAEQTGMRDLNGRVEILSADATVGEDGRSPGYRVQIAPDDGNALRPGTPVQVFLVTGSRTPLTYLLEPVTRYFSHALREG
ncbi:MAG: HlyD family type I secretion periplasmic adaptor subunit [Cereibacter sphaeroides]|uniref:Membrane fusion protein (MFP) family protein n=1 Tax=Cereibacter sphaeroides TaxID=1063 RepID=A0A2W5TPA6_CERSP|nr:MAG: HlyD family type I secretion periplasmic adaptor subunit [Cereibacter sphaeroides]